MKKKAAPKKKLPNPQTTVDNILAETIFLKENAEKFLEKGVGAACSRARKHAMNIKKLCGQLRGELQEIRNSSK